MWNQRPKIRTHQTRVGLLVVSSLYLFIVYLVLTSQYENSIPRPVKESDDASYSSHSRRSFGELDMNYLIPKDVFYIWCGPRRNFEFRHYLSVRSVFAYLKPYRVTFFYENEPIYSNLSYNSWLKELGQQYPYFSAEQLAPGWCDDKHENLNKHLKKNGGIFVQEEVILVSGFTDEQYRSLNRVTFFEDATKTTLLDISSRHVKTVMQNIKCRVSRRPVTVTETSWKLWAAETIQYKTGTVKMKTCNQQNRTTFPVNTVSLLVVKTSLFPEQIWELDSKTGRQLRTVMYGKPDLARPVPNYSQLAPNIAHVIWTNNDPMGFHFYLCVLSLLDVAKFDKVYIHGDGPPTGIYWDMIKDHQRLQLVKRTVLEGGYERIFGTIVQNRAHVTDVIRLDILKRYGGLYVDTDAIFFRPLTRKLRAYDAVVSPDISLPSDFPGSLQNGIMLGKPGAEFWSLLYESNKKYYDSEWLWNSCLSIYRIKERHPTVLLNEPRLNTICDNGKCHPTWERRLMNSSDEEIAKVMKQWRRNTYAIHHTYPDLPEFENHKALLLNNGTTTLMGEVGLYVLYKANKLNFFRNMA